MIAETVIEVSEPSQTEGYLRPLGPFEELLWLMDKRSPLHATLIAHVDGATTVDQWRAAVEKTRQRHPLWSVAVAEDGDSRPFFQRIGEPKIPFRVIEGDFSQSWEQEVGRELSRRIEAGSGSLVRAALLHTDSSCMLILVAHHSVCDGMSLAFALRDVLHALSGARLKALDLHSSQEDALGIPAQARVPRRKVEHRVMPARGATVYRSSSSTLPEVRSLQFSQAFTEVLRLRARQERTTIHGALLAASGIAARQYTNYGTGRDLHICSPINNRKLAQSPENFGVLFTAGDSAIPETRTKNFWGLARKSKDALSAAQTSEGACAILGAVNGIVQSGLDAASTAEQGGESFNFDLMLTNLGVVPIDSSYGALSLRQLWGPGVLVGLEGEQTLGVSTFNGRLSLLHTSHTPLLGLLGAIESTLIAACIS